MFNDEEIKVVVKEFSSNNIETRSEALKLLNIMKEYSIFLLFS